MCGKGFSYFHSDDFTGNYDPSTDGLFVYTLVHNVIIMDVPLKSLKSVRVGRREVDVCVGAKEDVQGHSRRDLV